MTLLRLAVLLAALAPVVGCSGTGESGGGDDPDREAQRAEEQARQLAAPHEAKARECESEGKLREAIKHYVAAIQALPEGNTTAKDFELREKVIKLVLSLDPPPAISEDVQQMFNRAEAMAKAAKDSVGWSNAAQEYERALRYAPWHAQANFNLGLLYESMTKVPSAICCLKLYLVAAPQASDRDEVQKKVTQLELKVRSSGLRMLEGTWRIHRYAIGPHFAILDLENKWQELSSPSPYHFTIHVRGREIDLTQVWHADFALYPKGDEVPFTRLKLTGRRLEGRVTPQWRKDNAVTDGGVQGVVSEDFREIRLSYGCVEEHWQSYYLKRNP